MELLNDRVLLITGGTGSFGQAVLRHLLDTNIKEIRIFSRDEKKQDDMRHLFQNKKITFYIGDTRDARSISAAMRGVDYVLHAAALKQVPSCEFFPMEAVYTNVLGTENVLNAAIEHKVKKIVALSTDKACYPINAMGISKAMMEKIVTAKGRTPDSSETVVCCTRYGNVLGSRGSVVPLWVEQILSGNAITLTNPEMTRFMMTLDDAVDLVFHAFEHAQNGDLFIQKAPAATLEVISQALMEIHPAHVGLRIIGTRHGEKLYESLATREEIAKAEDLGQYLRIPCDGRDLNYDRYFIKGEQHNREIEDYNSHNTQRLDKHEVKKMLLTLPVVQELMSN
jgi:Predicted nucleoside-diphosphate sugar epimerases